MANQIVRLDISKPRCVLASVEARSSLMKQIRAHKFDDVGLRMIQGKVLIGEAKESSLTSNGFLRIGGQIRLILEEAHCSSYSIYQEVTKMYHDLRKHY